MTMKTTSPSGLYLRNHTRIWVYKLDPYDDRSECTMYVTQRPWIFSMDLRVIDYQLRYINFYSTSMNAATNTPPGSMLGPWLSDSKDFGLSIIMKDTNRMTGYKVIVPFQMHVIDRNSPYKFNAVSRLLDPLPVFGVDLHGDIVMEPDLGPIYA